MRFATLRLDGTTRAARLDGGDAGLLPYADVGELLAADRHWRSAQAGRTARRVPLDDAELAPLVLRPGKIVCLGLNYRTHILEMGRELPEHPTLFAKFASTLLGANDPIRLPAASDEVDWEAELAVVLGARVHRASRGEATAAIAGYSVANDVSMRDWQWRTTQWLQGKAFDATTPLGPTLVTPDELGAEDGAPDLAITCDVDGDVKQSARTGDLLLDPADAIAYVSQMATLEPGDVILTGTPGGVGAGREPKQFLSSGQTVTVTVEGIGSIRNRCEADA